MMERSRLSLILVLLCGVFVFSFVDGREFRRETTCYNDVLHLDCGKSLIAVHEAYFTTATKQENHTCHSPALEHDYIEDNAESEEDDSVCREDVRVSLNRKCSGFKSCNYSYSQLPEKSCYNPEGLLVVRFDCVQEDNINKWCNSKVPSSEGYISSPGYPQYYPQLVSCSWSLIASEGQTIRASVLHLHLREAVDVTPTDANEMEFHLIGQLVDAVKRCDDDKLTIYEGVVKKAELCGEGAETLKSVEVEGVAGLELRFRSAGFNPASGFLVYFKIHGCPTLPPGPGVLLVERNGSAATYACRGKGQVFNDTLQGTRSLHCVRDHHWNDTLPPCVAMEETTLSTLTAVLGIEFEDEFGNSTAKGEMNPLLLDQKANLLADIIIPIVIIGGLLIINCIVLIIIYFARRRHKTVSFDDEFQDLAEDQPPPIVSEEKFEEESPPTSSKSQKRVTIKSPPTSPQESQPAPTISSATVSESQPSTSQAKESS